MIFIGNFSFDKKLKDRTVKGSFLSVAEATDVDAAFKKLMAFFKRKAQNDIFENITNIYLESLHCITGAVKTPAILDYKYSPDPEAFPGSFISCQRPLKLTRGTISYTMIDPDAKEDIEIEPFIKLRE